MHPIYLPALHNHLPHLIFIHEILRQFSHSSTIKSVRDPGHANIRKANALCSSEYILLGGAIVRYTRHGVSVKHEHQMPNKISIGPTHPHSCPGRGCDNHLWRSRLKSPGNRLSALVLIRGEHSKPKRVPRYNERRSM